MILTGNSIIKEWEKGKITIDPFRKENINPNSYNFCLDNSLIVYCENCIDAKKDNHFKKLIIPDNGIILQPRKLYLANTVETLGSDYYVPTYNARSSIARLGIFINLSATLCDIGFRGKITMQLYATNAVKLYPFMKIGQIMFWKPCGRVTLYNGKYQFAKGPRTTEIYRDFEGT